MECIFSLKSPATDFAWSLLLFQFNFEIKLLLILLVRLCVCVREREEKSICSLFPCATKSIDNIIVVGVVVFVESILHSL